MGLIVATANFYLTNAGKAAALDAANNSINIEVTKIAIGTAKYDAQVTAPTQTALTTEVGRYNLVGGGSSGQVLRLTTTLTPNYTAEIFEIGLFLSDGTLFAVAAVTGTDPLMQTANGLTSVITLGCSLAEVGSNVTVSVDANSPIAVVLMNQHIAHGDPHTQYLLKTDFNAGVIALQYADNVLQQNINTEEANRISVDNLINDKIDYEIVNRINALNDIENRKFNKSGGTVAGDALITGGLTVQTSLLLGSFLAAQNGYTPLPNGLILQWGKVSDDFAIYNFPIEFPNAAFALIGQQISGGGSSKVYVEIISKSQFKVFEGSSATDGTEFYWFAIGV